MKLYNLSAGKTLPEWLSEKRKRSLQKDQEFRRRIDLVQDFDFPIASQKIKFSPDGQYITASGTYPPRLKVFDLSQLSMKFERHVKCEIVQFLHLSDDFSKIVMLEADRSVEFHAQFGSYYRTRIPKVGRDMDYHSNSCDLLISGSSSEIYRLNLDQGQFLAPLVCRSPAVNFCHVGQKTGLVFAGGEGGLVECFDHRTKRSVGILPVGAYTKTMSDGPMHKPDVTAFCLSEDSLTIGVGTSSGHCHLYDLRSSRPFLNKFHQYQLPIVNIQFHRGDNVNVFSADEKVVKIWDQKMGDNFATIESEEKISDVCVSPFAGIVFLAGDAKRIQTYYIPSLGPAPKWCSFLDNLTEELEEENEPSLYTDFKFVTKQEIEQLGLSKMIGSEYVRAYMHGFFIDLRFYNKVRAVADPFAFQKYRKEQIQKKIEETSRTRIHADRKVPKVNPKLAEKLASDTNARSVTKAKIATTILEDKRFSALFSDENFARDSENTELQNFDKVSLYSRKSEHLPAESEPNMFELKVGHALPLKKKSYQSGPNNLNVPLELRTNDLQPQESNRVANVIGGKEVSFVPRAERKHVQRKEANTKSDAQSKKHRRGVKVLNLKRYPGDQQKKYRKR